MAYLDLPDRVYSQYANKPKTVAWLKITRIIAEEIASGAYAVQKCFDIDKATGETLDIISRIVVVDNISVRELLGSAVVAEKKADDGSLADQGTNLGKPKDATQPMVSEWALMKKGRLSDDVLRTIIRAKIAKNSCVPTHDGILRAFGYAFPDLKPIRLIDTHDMSFMIQYRGSLTDIEIFLLGYTELIPCPQGVQFNGFRYKGTQIEFVKNHDGMYQFANERLEFI